MQAGDTATTNSTACDDSLSHQVELDWVTQEKEENHEIGGLENKFCN